MGNLMRGQFSLVAEFHSSALRGFHPGAGPLAERLRSSSASTPITLRMWDKLTRFLDYPELELSNNLAENSMGPVRLAVATGPTSVTRRPDHASQQSSSSSKPTAESRSRSVSTSPLSCQGSPTLPSTDCHNSLPPPGPLAICNCQHGLA